MQVHIAQALAIVTRLKGSLHDDIAEELAIYRELLMEKYAPALAALSGAEQSLKARLAQDAAIKEEWYGQFRKSTPRPTTIKMKSKRNIARTRSLKGAR